MKPRESTLVIISACILTSLWCLQAQQVAPKLLPFQGRLTDQNGVAISNGVKVVQFKIYNVPTGGSPVWAGEIHRTTVNGGLVNVLLGTKTPLDGVDFDQQLYLEITVDVSGPGGIPDNAITAADPPMLPRQLIMPVVFASESGDSRKLAGADWSSIFGTNSPVGTIPGSKIQTQGITAAQIAPQTITSAQIAPQSITSNQIASGTIGAVNIAPGAVTLSNLAPKPVGTTVGIGGVAVSNPSGNWNSTTPNSMTQVPLLGVSLTTTGRPVMIFLSGDNPPSDRAFLSSSRQVGLVYAELSVQLTRDGLVVGYERQLDFGNNVMQVAPGCFRFFDNPGAGTHIYRLSIQGGEGPTDATAAGVNAVVLVAYEL
jgi:hypothetical protein